MKAGLVCSLLCRLFGQGYFPDRRVASFWWCCIWQLFVLDEQGDTTHVLEPDGNVRHLGKGTFSGGVVVGDSLPELEEPPLPDRLGNLEVRSLNGEEKPEVGVTGPVHLGQNAPNPFAVTTVIPFSPAVRALVRLKVVDAFDRVATTLVSENLPAGSYEVDFNSPGFIFLA